ncbi:DUF3619 family protein [Variovorax boronicumulans]|uniref:DUF3619 family protein n=1 Tax=Variovorax boronicumulans TaxID=436515 RepID=UPI001C570D8C
MNTSHPAPGQTPEAQFGRRVAARLSAGTDALPHDIGERLRVARAQALARRKLPARAAPVVVASGGGTATLGSIWWTRLGAVVPLVALVAGLISISVWQEDQRTSELAELDSALLTDALPPAAYTDPGFAQFLKSEAAQPQ